MEETITRILERMAEALDATQLEKVREVLTEELRDKELVPKQTTEERTVKANAEMLAGFLSAKKIEGCSDKTLRYYRASVEKLLVATPKAVAAITTNEIRCYLSRQQEERSLSKVTIDNLRRIFSSFFAWLEDEDYIAKSPVRRIHKVRTNSLVKEVLNDENLEALRDICTEPRDLAMVDLLASTGVRVGELVTLNRADIDFNERQCVVFGKGNKEREVYFDARAKLHLKRYLDTRTDDNPALFVSFAKPNNRLTIGAVERRLRLLGERAAVHHLHPHKFRRTLATMAIGKGMPIEQVQRLLGHVRIDTTLHYAMVSQVNVKLAHRKYIG